ncbi:MAG: class I SAM-dependent methyltransferase [Myxococcota bacterium]
MNTLIGAIAVMSLIGAGPDDPGAHPEHEGAHEHEHGHGGHGEHGNPGDLESYIRNLEDPERDEWQKPDEVVRALDLPKGAVTCHIGAGTGYFARRLGRHVAPEGHVFAVDVEARMLEALRKRLKEEDLRNVSPVLALPGDPLLPRGACDLVLIVNTYHHFPDGPAYLEGLKRVLKPKGRIANVDFYARELPVGPPVGHKVSREAFLKDAEKAGLKRVAEHDFLPHQYFLVFEAE